MPQVKKHWFSSRWFLTICFVVFCLITISLVKQVLLSYQIDGQVASLNGAINTLQEKNKKDADFVEYLKTDTYFQQQARQQLGMKAPGEKMLVLQQPTDTTAETVETNSQVSQDTASSNPRRWLTYFFGQK